jgi:hypothetical protein
MSDLILNMLILSFLLMLASSGTTSATSKPSPRTLSNSSFYRYLSSRLPANETTVAGKDLEWCPQSHVPDSQFKLQLRL